MKDAIPRLLKRNTKAASLRHKTLSTFGKSYELAVKIAITELFYYENE